MSQPQRNAETVIVERVQTGVRMEKRMLKVLKALADSLDLSLGDLLEGIVLHAFEGKAQGVHVEQVALYDVHTRWKAGFGGVTHECPHVCAPVDELLDNLAADVAGGAGDKDGHENYSVWLKEP